MMHVNSFNGRCTDNHVKVHVAGMSYSVINAFCTDAFVSSNTDVN